MKPSGSRTKRTEKSYPGADDAIEDRYLALFVDVRRQRVQTSAFVATPFWVMMNGWRFGW
jgi:hypothetical protein